MPHCTALHDLYFASATHLGGEEMGCNGLDWWCGGVWVGPHPPAPTSAAQHRLHSTYNQQHSTYPPTFPAKEGRPRRETPHEAQGRRGPASPCRPQTLRQPCPKSTARTCRRAIAVGRRIHRARQPFDRGALHKIAARYL